MTPDLLEIWGQFPVHLNLAPYTQKYSFKKWKEKILFYPLYLWGFNLEKCQGTSLHNDKIILAFMFFCVYVVRIKSGNYWQGPGQANMNINAKDKVKCQVSSVKCLDFQKMYEVCGLWLIVFGVEKNFYKKWHVYLQNGQNQFYLILNRDLT